MPRDTIMPEHHAFVNAVAAGLRHRCGVAEGEHLLLAVSGGADSVALLRAAAAIAGKRTWRLTLTVAHVQHHLRDVDGAAEADAQFVNKLCGQLNLPFVRKDLHDLPHAPGNREAAARQARYHALHGLAVEHGAARIVVAHHADDQMETILMRMLRGAGVKGLSAMPWTRPLQGDPAHSAIQLIRPMLAVSRSEVLGFLGDIDQSWRTDHTNADISRLRARLRNDVMPALHDLQPQLAARAVQLSGHFRELNDFLEAAADAALADAVLSTMGNETGLDRGKLRQLPTVVLSTALRTALHRHAAVPLDRLTRSVLEPMASAVADGEGGERVFELEGGASLIVVRDRLVIRSG